MPTGVALIAHRQHRHPVPHGPVAHRRVDRSARRRLRRACGAWHRCSPRRAPASSGCWSTPRSRCPASCSRSGDGVRWPAMRPLPWVVHLLRRSAGIETIGSATSEDVERYADVPTPQAHADPGAARPAARGDDVVRSGLPARRRPARRCPRARHAARRSGSWQAAACVADGRRGGRGGCGGGQPARGPDRSSGPAAGPRSSVYHRPGPPRSGSPGWPGSASATARSAALAIALYVPVLVAPLVARSWRFTWAIRAAGLVLDVRLARRSRRPGIVVRAPSRAGRAARPGRRRRRAVCSVHRRCVPGRRARRVVRLAATARTAQRGGHRRSASCPASRRSAAAAGTCPSSR